MDENFISASPVLNPADWRYVVMRQCDLHYLTDKNPAGNSYAWTRRLGDVTHFTTKRDALEALESTDIPADEIKLVPININFCPKMAA